MITEIGESALAYWYSINGVKHGPVNQGRVIEMIQAGQLTAENGVWCDGLADWQTVGTSNLSSYLCKPGQPPPLTGSAVNNTVIWFLAFAPLLGMFLQGFMFGLTGIAVGAWWPITIALNILLCVLDEKKVKAAGHNTKALGSTWLVPVYIFKRTKMLKQNWAVFVIWCITFLMCLCS